MDKMAARSLSIIVVLLLLVAQASALQQKTVRQFHNNSKADTIRLRTLYELGDYYLLRKHQDRLSDFQNAEKVFFTAYGIADSENVISKYGKYEFQCKLAEVFVLENQPEKAMSLFIQAAKFYHDRKFIAKEANTYLRCVINIWPGSDDYEGMQTLLFKALRIYEELNQPGDIVFTNYWIALTDLHRNRANNYRLTEARCNQMIVKYQHTNALHLDYIYSLLSRINRYRGNLNKSLSYSLKSMQLMNSTKDTTAEEQIFAELAQTYQDLEQTENSIVYYKKTIEIRERKNIPQEYLFRTAGFIAQGLIKLHRPVEALNYIEALEKRHKPDNKAKYAFIEQIKGYCYEALRDYKKAEEAYLGMINDYRKGDDEMWYIAKYDIARFYVLRKQYLKAAAFLNDNTPPSNFSKAKDLEYLLFQVDSSRGRFLSAIRHFRKYKTMNDSVFNLSKSKQVEELQLQYRTSQRETEIKLLTKESQLQRQNVIRAQNARNLTYAGIAVLSLFVGLLYYNYWVKQRNNIVLNQLVLEKDALLQEKEWFIKEIHHRVKNNLQIVMGLLQRQSAYINNEEALKAIRNSEDRMHSIALIHQKLYQSDSPGFIYMPEYIAELVNYLKDSFDLGNRIHFQKDVDDVYLNVSQAVPLGLILNEAITNAIKYAFTDQTYGEVSISFLATTDGCHHLMIKDNGAGLPQGFDSSSINSMGINLMKGLTKQLGGLFKMTYDSGMIVLVKFKVENSGIPENQYNQQEGFVITH
ncbi:hypothetical protein GS399_03800 [Pedobacter sp. HMF7647]|uniref:histidine kinase n=1 Tax=Hufsiella arboris TaxID=2695275 RepID=A0A7K1Y676_9SPHI|nr:sensor histidine kinase [Hufsiella arboris]MXV50084.1 hypothetical protein [Hufsiella arboris]